MVQYTSIILYLRVKYPLESFVSYVYPVNSSMNQELFKNYSVPL